MYDSTQGISWPDALMKEDRSRYTWVGAPAVPRESSGPGNTASGVHGEGQLYIQIETGLSLKVASKTH